MEQGPMKLSPTQQRLIELMREGRRLMWWGDNGPELEGTPFWPQKSTVRSLIRREVLRMLPPLNTAHQVCGIYPVVLTTEWEEKCHNNI
jgi:hypothetical protein